MQHLSENVEKVKSKIFQLDYRFVFKVAPIQRIYRDANEGQVEVLLYQESSALESNEYLRRVTPILEKRSMWTIVKKTKSHYCDLDQKKLSILTVAGIGRAKMYEEKTGDKLEEVV